MAQLNEQSRFGGPYMIQDRDHMSEIPEAADNAKRGARQSQQSQSEDRQQGGDDPGANSQGGGRRQRLL